MGVEDQVARLHGHLGVGHGAVIQTARLGGFGGGVALNAVRVHQIGQPRDLGGVVRPGDHIGSEVAPRLLGISTVVCGELLEHAVGVCRRGLHGGESALGVVLDAVSQRQRVAHCCFHRPASPAASTLLVSHAHGAAEHGPRVPVGRVQQVKHLPCEVQRPALVEVLGVVPADVPLTFPLPWRHNLVVRLRRGCEIVGAVDPLFVEVDVHLRHPRLIKGGPRLGFPLGLPSQVAVHVKQVVVGSSARPRLVVFPSVRVGVGPGRGGLVLEMHVPVTPVWVDARIHDHHSALEQVAVRRGQGFRRRHGRFGAHRLVAVHVVRQVHPHHAVSGIHPFRHPASVGFTQGTEVGHVLFGGHDEPQQGAAFGGGPVMLELPMGSGLRQMGHDVHNLVVSGEFVPEVVAQHVGHIHVRGGRLGLHRHPSAAQQQGRHPSAHLHGCNIASEGAWRVDFGKSDGLTASVDLCRRGILKENAANEHVERMVHDLPIPSVFGQFSDFQRVGVDEKKRCPGYTF